MKRRYTVVDLFCGAGGLSRGFMDAGFDVVLGVDFDVYYDSHSEALAHGHRSYEAYYAGGDGKEIEVLEFDDFLAMFKLDREKLDRIPQLDIEYLKDKKYSKIAN